jgi:hypothetical protein
MADCAAANADTGPSLDMKWTRLFRQSHKPDRKSGQVQGGQDVVPGTPLTV